VRPKDPARVLDQLALERCRERQALWGIPVQLRYRPWRVDCPACGVKVESIPWSAGKSPIAVPLMVVLATWSRILAWDVVAKLFGVSWQTVVDAVDAAVAYGRTVERYGGVTHVGIDELSRKKGHVYHTNIYDLGSKRLLWSGEGRGTDTIEEFFTWWGPERSAALRGVCLAALRGGAEPRARWLRRTPES
jgi:transposase